MFPQLFEIRTFFWACLRCSATSTCVCDETRAVCVCDGWKDLQRRESTHTHTHTSGRQLLCNPLSCAASSFYYTTRISLSTKYVVEAYCRYYFKCKTLLYCCDAGIFCPPVYILVGWLPVSKVAKNSIKDFLVSAKKAWQSLFVCVFILSLIHI